MIKYIVFFLSSPLFLLTQNRVEGTIVEKNSKKPLVGCSVYNVQRQTGTIANENGEYSIIATKGELIQFTYIGMEIVEKYISSDTDTLHIEMQYQTKRLKNIIISSTNNAKKSVLYNPEYEKEQNKPSRPINIVDYKSYMSPMGFLASPITALYYTFSPRLRKKITFMEKIQQRDLANQKYSYQFISLITKVEDEEELRKIKTHCYFDEELILNASYYQLGLMTKECYLEYLDLHKP